VLDYFTEVAEQLLPAHEPNEKFFRLLVAMLAYLREGGGTQRTAEGVVRDHTWTAVTYFTVWTVRLLGLWPEARVSDENRRNRSRNVRTADHCAGPRECRRALPPICAAS